MSGRHPPPPEAWDAFWATLTATASARRQRRTATPGSELENCRRRAERVDAGSRCPNLQWLTARVGRARHNAAIGYHDDVLEPARTRDTPPEPRLIAPTPPAPLSPPTLILLRIEQAAAMGVSVSFGSARSAGVRCRASNGPHAADPGRGPARPAGRSMKPFHFGRTRQFLPHFACKANRRPPSRA
jgi:hypothetical protein